MTNKKANVAISVRNVSKQFKLPHDSTNSLKSRLINFKKRGYEIQHALRDVSFEVNEGDFFGIVGRNGSGKSTLLKIISGIYTPTRGDVHIKGKLTPFIELGVGFNPELSGRDNVFLNGALLGFTRAEMEERYDAIVEFAELERFMDQKLKNYSSGMQVRLAFSIAIQADTEILVLDEVLAVGDEAFQRKCNDYFMTLKKNKKTVILVTHSMDNVRKYCNKALMLQAGSVVEIGRPEDIANKYSYENLTSKGVSRADGKDDEPRAIKDLNIKLLTSKKVTQKDEIRVNISYTLLEDTNTKIMLNFIDIDKQVPIYASSTKPSFGRKNQRIERTLRIKTPEINNANMRIIATIRDEKNNMLAFPTEESLPIVSLYRDDYLPEQKGKTPYAIMFNRGRWEE